MLNLDIENNHIKIVISPNFYWRLNKTDNSSEKELCKFVIGILCDFSSDNFDYESYIEKIFSNPMKKKIVFHSTSWKILCGFSNKSRKAAPAIAVTQVWI